MVQDEQAFKKQVAHELKAEFEAKERKFESDKQAELRQKLTSEVQHEVVAKEKKELLAKEAEMKK